MSVYKKDGYFFRRLIMAATFSTATKTVLGDQRVVMGVVHMNDGAESINFGGFKVINFMSADTASCATAGFTKIIQKGTAAGSIRIASCSSGDAFNFLVMGK